MDRPPHPFRTLSGDRRANLCTRPVGTGRRLNRPDFQPAVRARGYRRQSGLRGGPGGRVKGRPGAGGTPRRTRCTIWTVAAPDRFAVLAVLPSHGGFRRVLALDCAGAARAVVLAFAPAALTEDPAALAAVLRDAEAAARLHHPGAAAVLGTETVGGELAVVELHRPGATLRTLLDASGRLPPDVAVRILLDACAAAGRAHSIDAGDGRRLTHGALDPARIVIGEDGAAFACGFGLAGGVEPEADVCALGAVLFECLAGEPPRVPPGPLDVPGVAAALATAVDRATGAQGEPFASAAALAGAVVAAIPPASHDAVAAYVDAILPVGEGERAELDRTLATALGRTDAGEVPDVPEVVVEPTAPGLAAPHARPVGRGVPPATPDAAGTFPKPSPRHRGSRIPVLVAVVCLGAGFAIGLELARARRTPTATPAHPERSAAAGGAQSKGTPTPTPTAKPTANRTATSEAPAPVSAPPSRRPARERPARPVPARAAGHGKLDVTAPDDAEIFLDGRRIGTGSVQLEVTDGPHRIEVRRAGATAAERFTLKPGETWTYTVTPTP